MTKTDNNPRKANLIDHLVAQQLRRRRTEVAMSQQELASKLGLSFQQLQKYEHGTNRISAARLYDLSQHLDVPMSYFFEGSDNLPTPTPNSTQTDPNNALGSKIKLVSG